MEFPSGNIIKMLTKVLFTYTKSPFLDAQCNVVVGLSVSEKLRAKLSGGQTLLQDWTRSRVTKGEMVTAETPD